VQLGVPQVTGWPVHGSGHVAPHQFGGQAVAGVQHSPVSAFEHCVPGVVQFAEQSRFPSMHGSKTLPQKLAGHVIGVQQ
jgi:hypothetical protein